MSGAQRTDPRFRRAAACPLLVAIALTPASGVAAQQAGDDYYPVTIENCGHTLTFDEAPSRAVLGYQPVAEIFVGLGLADRAIGRVSYDAAHGGVPLLTDQAEAFEPIPNVSDTPYPPPREQMLALRPDFLLAVADFDYDGEQGLAAREDLEAAGGQVYTVVCPDEAGGYTNENLEATYRTILDLGAIFGISDRAQQRVDEMQAQIAGVSQRVSDQPVAKVIAYYDGEGPLELAGGRDTIITQMIEAAGGENVFADTDMLFFRVPLETVASQQADAFFIFGGDAEAKAQFLFDTFPTCRPARTAASSPPASRHPGGVTRRRSRTSLANCTRRRSSR